MLIKYTMLNNLLNYFKPKYNLTHAFTHRSQHHIHPLMALMHFCTQITVPFKYC